MRGFLSRRVLLAALLLFLVLLLLTAPARVLVTSLGLHRAGLYFHGVSGRWHEGESRELQIHTPSAAVRLADVRWDLKLSQLFLGRFAAEFTARFSEQPVAVNVSHSLFGETRVNGLTVGFSLLEIKPLLRDLLIPLDGFVRIEDLSFSYSNSWFTFLQGRVQLRSLLASLPAADIDIGDLLLELKLAESDGRKAPLLAESIDYQGRYGIDVNLRMQPNRSYTLTLGSRPDDTVPTTLVQQMGMLFGPPLNGRHQFIHTGRL